MAQKTDKEMICLQPVELMDQSPEQMKKSIMVQGNKIALNSPAAHPLPVAPPDPAP